MLLMPVRVDGMIQTVRETSDPPVRLRLIEICSSARGWQWWNA